MMKGELNRKNAKQKTARVERRRVVMMVVWEDVREGKPGRVKLPGIGLVTDQESALSVMNSIASSQ